MNAKEFRELKKDLENKVNESIRGFNGTNQLDARLEADHISRISMYADGVNNTLKILAEKNDLRYVPFRWPTYKKGKDPNYSEIKIS